MYEIAGNGYCVAHTIELRVKEFLDAPGISEVLKKAKGMTTLNTPVK